MIDQTVHVVRSGLTAQLRPVPGDKAVGLVLHGLDEDDRPFCVMLTPAQMDRLVESYAATFKDRSPTL